MQDKIAHGIKEIMEAVALVIVILGLVLAVTQCSRCEREQRVFERDWQEHEKAKGTQ